MSDGHDASEPPSDERLRQDAKAAAAREREDQLSRALDKGRRELPPNQVKGLLGEPGLNVGKTDTFEPDLNSGISQEVDFPVIWLTIVLLLVSVILSPIGFVMLWRSKTITRRAKVLWTVIGAAWIVGILFYARFGHGGAS